MTAVHQFVPSYAARSAIGTHVAEVQRTLREMGLDSRIYVGDSQGVPASAVHPYLSFRPTPGQPTWVMYQLSTGHPMADFLAERNDRLLVNYHNITPAELFQPWEPLLVPELEQGREQLHRLAPRAELAVADSAYNEQELRQAGYRSTTTVPVLVDFEALAAQEDEATAARLDAQKRDGGDDWLFVGRVSPNKCQHRLILALAAYRRMYGRPARLRLVGGVSSPFYDATLRKLVSALGLGDAVELTGSVRQAELVSYYRHADVFVSLSEHEGFGVPLVEAMWHEVPVVALGSSGVTDTVGPAGLVLPLGDGGTQPPVSVVAAAAERVRRDDGLRAQLTALGTQRAQHFLLTTTRPLFRRAIEAVVGG